jgi:hypothetical protein
MTLQEVDNNLRAFVAERARTPAPALPVAQRLDFARPNFAGYHRGLSNHKKFVKSSNSLFLPNNLFQSDKKVFDSSYLFLNNLRPSLDHLPPISVTQI